MVLRAAPFWGGAWGAWPDHLSLPQTNSRNCWGIQAVQAEGGARPGLYRSLWEVVLEEASWSRRGGVVDGGLSEAVGTSLLQTLFLSPK